MIVQSGQSGQSHSFTSVHLILLLSLRLLRQTYSANRKEDERYTNNSVFCGSLESVSIDQTASTSVRFILSETPFCSGVFGIVAL